jgi:1-acyl-sn-glycerol-3-phosphate acyltransferase
MTPRAAAPADVDTPSVLVTPTPTYRIVRVTTGLALRLLLWPRYEGVDNIPKSGRILLVSNHQSFLDIPLMSTAVKKRHVSFVARDSLAKAKWLAFVMRECGAVLIRRGQPDRAALREMVAHLEGEDALVIYPEGTRTPDGRVQPFHGGALLAARLTNAPIIPVGIRGAIEAWPRGAKWPRPSRVALRFGPPIDSSLPDALERAHAAIEAMVGDGRFRSVPPVD